MTLDTDISGALDGLSPDQLASIAEIIRGAKKDQIKNDTKPPLRLPIEDTVKLIQDIQSLGLKLGDREPKLERWYQSIHALLDNYHNELKQDELHLNEEFIKSLDTIAKIFKVLKNYQNEYKDDLLDNKVEKLIDDYRQGKFVDLSQYCNESETMSAIIKEVEQGILKFKPILVEKIMGISKVIREFYTRLELVDGYKNERFFNEIPTPEESFKYSTIEEVDDIKGIMATKFSRSSPVLLEQITNERANLEKFIKVRCTELNKTIEEIRDLSHELDMDVKLDLKHYDNEDLIQKVGLKGQCFQRYQDQLESLKTEKNHRSTQLNALMSKLEDLWAVLRPNDNSIQDFLKNNKNLKLQSIANFEELVEKLEQEKKENISKFIELARSRIHGFWDLLMYDEQDRLKFKAYYIDDDAEYNEFLLEEHNEEIARLRYEVESLKPLLQSISKLDELLREKSELDEAVKDPNRLLKRDSFKILRQEEKVRDKLAKQLPSTINDLKEQLVNYQSEKGRAFKVNGKPYILHLENIESELCRKRSYRRSPIRPSPIKPIQRSLRREPVVSSVRRDHYNVQPKRQSLGLKSARSKILNPYREPTIIESVIRKTHTSDMTNPFDSKESSPIKERLRSRSPEHLDRQPDNSQLYVPPVHPPVFAKTKLTSPNKAIQFMTGSTISNKPIVIKGGSPIRSQEKPQLRTRPQLIMPSLSPVSRSPPRKKVQMGKLPDPLSLKPLNFEMKIPSPPSSLRTINTSQETSNRRVFSYERPSVAELSDSLIDYSEEAKENVNLLPAKSNGTTSNQILNDMSMNWDTETF